MKLTKEQIQTIENILEKRGVDYVDLKYELLDHIATEVEQLMTNDVSVSFKGACDIAFEKWKDALKSSSSFWFGFANFIPNILLQKCVAYTKKYELIFILGALIFGVFLYLIKTNVLYVLNEFKYLFIGVVFLHTLIILIGLISIKKSGYSTTYSYLFKLRAYPFCLLLLQFNNLIFGYTSTKDWVNIMNFSLFILLIFSGFYTVVLLKKHFRYKTFKRVEFI